MKMVRTSPDVEENDRPEVNDRQTVGIYRTISLFWHEIIHHRQEWHGKEERNCVMSIPPLSDCILYARKSRIAFNAEERDRYRQIVDDMQHCHGDDEREIKPVRHINMWFFTPKNGP